MAISAKDVDKILEKNKRALKGQLIANAASTTSDTIGKAASKYRESVSSITKEYIEQYKRGGSYCPDPNHLGKAKFVKWIDERYEAAKEDITEFLKTYDTSKNPMELAKELSEIIDKDIDSKMIMRTETEKIRTAAKIDNMKKNNAKYVRYVAVMDDRVRESHAALDGQIFPIDEAPVLGEPNCRCTYVPATEMEYETTKKENNGEDWTATKAQKWLESDNGKRIGAENAIRATENVNEKRKTFIDFFSEAKSEKERLEFVKQISDSYKPDWCRVPLEKLVTITPEAFKSYVGAQEATTDAFDATLWTPDEDAKALYTKKELELYTKRLNVAKDTIVKDFPELAKGIKNVKITINNDTAFDWGKKTIYYNPQQEKSIAEAIKKGILSEGSDDYVLVHEMGHTLQHMAMGYKEYAKIAQVQKDSVAFWNEFAERYKLNIFYGKKIKNYEQLEEVLGEQLKEGFIATTGRGKQFSIAMGDEFIAEAVTDYYMNGNKCEYLSKCMVEFLKEKTQSPLSEMTKLVAGKSCDKKMASKLIENHPDVAKEVIVREAGKNPVTEAVMKKISINVDTNMQELVKDVALISNISTYFGIGKASVELMQGGSPSEVLDAYISGLCSTFEILFLGKFLAKHKVFHVKPEKGTLKTIMKKHFTGNATPETTEVMNSMKRFIQTDGREV